MTQARPLSQIRLIITILFSFTNYAIQHTQQKKKKEKRCQHPCAPHQMWLTTISRDLQTRKWCLKRANFGWLFFFLSLCILISRYPLSMWSFFTTLPFSCNKASHFFPYTLKTQRGSLSQTTLIITMLFFFLSYINTYIPHTATKVKVTMFT